MSKMLKTTCYLINLSCMFLFFFSNQSMAQSDSQGELKLRMEQRAIISATVFRDNAILQSYVRTVQMKLKANDQNDESISFDELATPQSDYIAAFAQQFKKAYLQVLEGKKYYNALHYANLPAGKPSGKINADFNSKDNDPFFFNDRAQIYFPYSENFSASAISSVYVTWYPLGEAESNTAYFVNDKLETNVLQLDENNAMKNPVLVINFDESSNSPSLVSGNKIEPAFTCRFLNENIFADLLDDKYVITVTMPKIKLLRNFRTWLGGSNLITIYAFFAKPNNLNINPSPALDPVTADKRLVCVDYRIRRKYKDQWVSFGQIFNDDWRLIQYDNPFYAWYKSGWFVNPTGSIDVKVQGGLKLDQVNGGYQWVPSFNSGATAAIHFDIEPKYQVIGSDYVSRRGLLANCVGNNFGNGTALDAGEDIPWAVRKIGDAFLYYLKVRECH
jgi:hypothetical protein